MATLAIKLVLALTVILGGAGVAASAAQGSLPNEALYPIKLLMEEVQLSLAATPDAQIDAYLEQAQQRVDEMAQLTNRGTGIPADVPARLQAQLQAALQIAAQLDDLHLQAALDRLQLRTQDQLREMDRLHLAEATQVLTQVRETAQLGLMSPRQFRARVGAGRPFEAPPQPSITPQATVTPSHTPLGPNASVTPQATCTPQHTPQPRATGTPQLLRTSTPQGQSYGPGPQQPAATPVGQGDGHEYGPGPQATSASGGGGPQPQNGSQGMGGPHSDNTRNSGGSGSGSGSQSGNTSGPASPQRGSGGPGGQH